MDAQLAFIMTNMAQIKPGHLTVDPFVGTGNWWQSRFIIFVLFNLIISGSILVSAAQRGSYVMGWDIDFMTLHARSKPTRHSQVSINDAKKLKALTFIKYL